MIRAKQKRKGSINILGTQVFTIGTDGNRKHMGFFVYTIATILVGLWRQLEGQVYDSCSRNSIFLPSLQFNELSPTNRNYFNTLLNH